MSTDSSTILAALARLRLQGHRIPVHDGPRLMDWFDGLAELIAELPTEDQRMAWVVLIGNDLCCRIPGIPIAMAAAPLAQKVLALQGCSQE